MITYDPRGMTWDQYCKLMEELFAPQQLGHLPEDQWRDWGNAVANIGYFMASGIADTRNFETWQDWASHLCGTMTIISSTSVNAVA
jgi:hypothetical protein